ncbi:TIGR03086 family metal-binding protein [Catenuloplanes atrovinosus]|uniref:Uncharacterized protein (TIGR03086 family) n=1 Tax=Catenuloplanes atrovinosus TaxID=137266 RepID=A0AAE4CB24_9ACTN|nr:TIGR03086 family metal-binding protein [Catenuloplanes atrovinosus]MDR7275175.1 uncharacterized protein (TIGR03086 family) [Catenuloplanes atrovinosus]
MTTSALLMIPEAIDRFGARVRGVPADRWDDPTPCTEWTVRDLVNHLVGEHLWAPHILAGEPLEQVGNRYDGDVVGADPVAAWERAAARSRALWPAADPAGPVQLSFGTVPLRDYADQMLVDLTVHQWDLARGSGQDETLDPAAVAYGLAYARANVERFIGMGVTAPPVPTTSTDPTVQLISLCGREV